MTSQSLPRRDIRVALIDDHQLVLHGLSSLLSADPVISITGTYTSAPQLMSGLKTLPVDVVVMDYELAPNDTDGLNLIKMLTTRYPALNILVVSSHYNPATVALALRGGARGFIGKNRPPEVIQKAIHDLHRGKIFIEEEMSRQLADQQHFGDALVSGKHSEENVKRAVTLAVLSPKELEVIRCFLTGMTVTDIAEKFNRSLKTISGQKQSAMRKLGLKADHELFIIKEELLRSLPA